MSSPPPPVLLMWVIYENPTDYPDKFVVREWRVEGGQLQVSVRGPAVVSSLKLAREWVPEGLHRIPRSPDDDPVVVETWL